MNDQLFSNIVTLAAVAFGWLLGEGSGWIKSRRKVSTVRKALRAELQDMCLWAGDVENTLIAIGSKVTKGERPSDVLVKIAHPVFTEHFAQICTDLPTSERLSFTAIHRLVEALHAQYEKLAEMRSRYEKEEWTMRHELIHLLTDMYVNARFISYRVTWHLEKVKEDTDKLSLHKPTQELMKQFHDEFEKIISTPE